MSAFHEWSRDLRHAARSLRRTPGFTAMAVGTLALAIGVNAGIFSVVDTVLIRPFPYAHADRLIYVAASAPGSDMPSEFSVSAEMFLQYKEQSKLLEDVGTFSGGTSTLRVGDRVERVRMSWPSNSMFTTLGVKPVFGRLPSPDEEDRVALISYTTWKTWFGGDSSVLGKSYYMSGADRTVVGVMGPDFRFPFEGTQVWIPTDVRAAQITTPGRFGIALVARTAPGASPAAVAAELTALAKRLPERFGGSPRYAQIMAQHRAVVRTLDEQMLGFVKRPLWILLGAVTIVLLIACANVANLFMVRAEGRQRDLAVRRAIGAARGQLIRLQLSESVVVAGLAGAIAVLLTVVSLPVFLRAAPEGIPRLADAGLDATTLAFTLAAAALAALACGAVPAIRASAPDLNRLREGGRGSTRRRHYLRDGLVVGQTALALVLLIGSGLLVRSFVELRNVDPGYDTKDLFTFQIAPQRPSLNDGPSFARFDLEFMDRLRALPGVQAVGLVDNIPLDEGTSSMRFQTEKSGAGADAGPILQFTFAAGDYFKAMGISVKAGRVFETNDHISALGNVVVSEAAAKLMWPGENPVGRRIRGERDSTTWMTVIGVVENVLQGGFREQPQPVIYLPLVGSSPRIWAVSSPAYVVKTKRAEFIAPEVRALVRQVAPEAPMYRIYTMAELSARSMVDVSFTMLTLGVASALALILGAVGLYGVLSYIVAERTREIGVRMALGARAEQVRRMVVVQGTRVVGIGVVIGIVAALASARALGSLLFGVKAVDVVTYAAMSVSMLGVGLLASYLPARRASNVDPVESLRGDG